jgi:hypothetical protein
MLDFADWLDNFCPTSPRRFLSVPSAGRRASHERFDLQLFAAKF